MVAPAGTTFGVADPTSRSTPSSPSATNIVAGSELSFSTVTVQVRAFGGTGPSAGGSSGGTGVGLGKTGGGGLGKENGGMGTPAGTYSSAAPVETHVDPPDRVPLSHRHCHPQRGPCRRAGA